MIHTIYGVPTNLLIKWLLGDEFKGRIENWTDLGCGNGWFLSQIGIVPREGFAVDVREEPPQLPRGFRFIKSEVNAWLAHSPKVEVMSLFGLVEHLKKKDALGLIDKAEKAARSVLISTPSGFLKQDKENEPELGENHWQYHKSGFSPRELADLGYAVFVFKYYHLRPNLAPHSFDELFAYKREGYLESDYKNLAKKLIRRSWIYNLNPLHLYRTMRQAKRHAFTPYSVPKIPNIPIDHETTRS